MKRSRLIDLLKASIADDAGPLNVSKAKTEERAAREKEIRKLANEVRK